MSASPCRCGPPARPWRWLGIAAWSVPALPAAAFALMPKCPACVAVYAALGTGMGISLTTAAHIRPAMAAVSVALLALVAGGFAWARFAAQKET